MAGTATVTYFYESGFSVAVGKTLLVFDYSRGVNSALPEDMQIGARDFQPYDRVIVFASCMEKSCFDDVIFTWDSFGVPISFFVSYDFATGKRGKRMKPGDEYSVEDVHIRAYGSTYHGVSYYVTIGEMHIFHAGMLNFWHWRDKKPLSYVVMAEEDFYATVHTLEKLPIDICMFPLDPKLGGMFEAGANHFIMTVKPRLFIPMYFHDSFEAAIDYAHRGKTRYTEVLPLTKPREKAEITFEDTSLTIHTFTPVRREATPDSKAPSASENGSDLSLLNTSDPFMDTDLPVQLNDMTKPDVNTRKEQKQ